MSTFSPEQNKQIVLEAFDTLFNRRDYKAAEKFWSPNYIQHSAHIALVGTACSTWCGRLLRPCDTRTPSSSRKATT